MLAALALHAAEPADEDKEMEQLLAKMRQVQRANQSFGEPAKTQLALTEPELARLTEYYRTQFPYRSLRQRLTYEEQLKANRPLPKLSAQAAARLDARDDPQGMADSRRAIGESLRADSLRMLHSANVRQFITQEGFGIRRFGPPSPSMLELPSEEPIQSDEPPVVSAEYFNEAPVRLPPDDPGYYMLLGENWTDIPDADRDATALRAYQEWTRRNNPLQLPTANRLTDVHVESARGFADRWTNGDVRDLDHVAGFTPHIVEQVPRVDMHAPWLAAC